MIENQINHELLAACKARLACDEDWDQGTTKWHDAVLTADEQMRVAIRHAETGDEAGARRTLELMEIHRLNQLNAEMLAMLKDVAELLAEDTGEWIDSVKALIEKAEAKQPEKAVVRIVVEMMGGTIETIKHDDPTVDLDVIFTENGKYSDREEETEIDEDTFLYTWEGSTADRERVNQVFEIAEKARLKDDELVFRNYYKCPYDGHEWVMDWPNPCNDRCPICNREIEPYKTEENE